MRKLRVLAASAATLATAGLLVSAPLAAHAVAPGTSAVAVTGTNHQIYYYQSDTRTFVSLGGATIAAPAVMVSPTNVVYVVVIGSNKHLYVRKANFPDTWRRADGPTTACGQPGVAMDPRSSAPLTAVLGCRGNNGALYASTATFTDGQDPVWSTFTNLGGAITGGPAIAYTGSPPTATFYVTGVASPPTPNVYSRTSTTGYVKVSNYSCASVPAVSVNTTTFAFACRLQRGVPFVAINGVGRALTDGRFLRTPAIVASATADMVTLYGEGSNGALYERVVAPTLGSFRSDGGALLAGAGAASFRR